MNARLAVTLTRWWTRFYTLGLPADVRAARCAEIDSDLWESLHDPDVSKPQILPRLAAGVLDDVGWRAGHCADESRTVWLTIATSCLLLVAMWEWLARPTVMRLIAESVWVYPLVESVHVLGVATFVGLTVILDLRLLGFTLRSVPVTEVAGWVLPWAAPGGIVAVVSGMIAFLPDPQAYSANLFFQIKLAALALAVANLTWFHLAIYSRVTEWDQQARPPVAARVSAACSLVLWATVIVAGRLIAFNWFQ